MWVMLWIFWVLSHDTHIGPRWDPFFVGRQFGNANAVYRHFVSILCRALCVGVWVWVCGCAGVYKAIQSLKIWHGKVSASTLKLQLHNHNSLSWSQVVAQWCSWFQKQAPLADTVGRIESCFYGCCFEMYTEAIHCNPREIIEWLLEPVLTHMHVDSRLVDCTCLSVNVAPVIIICVAM